MSDSDQSHESDDSKSQLTLSKAQQLRKDDIIAELKKRGVEVDEDTYRDILRKQLVDLVRAEIESQKRPEQPCTRDENKEGPGRSNEKFDVHKIKISRTENTSKVNTSNVSSDESEMAENTKLLFHLKTDDWEAFIERLELYLVVKKIEDDKMQAATLLTHFDEEAYILIRSLCAPDKPATKKFTDLVRLMSEHLNPKPSEVMDRAVRTSAECEPN
ncbi:uncharacterized protein LOC143214585 [Lasioglossum baleicum]|uniref:uncharacterized protein LOC143214585 n=1 Tax=Lasioglossum baleicum TaxID=434251 RepID=UPI003FCDC75D